LFVALHHNDLGNAKVGKIPDKPWKLAIYDAELDLHIAPLLQFKKSCRPRYLGSVYEKKNLLLEKEKKMHM